MDDHTLVGEYIGNPDYQHLVNYEKTTIVFYASVPKNEDKICEPLLDMFEKI